MRANRLTRILGACGPLSAASFLAADRIGAALTPGYSSRTQAISELIEAGAPFKHVVDPLLLLFHALVIPFALGLHRALRDQRRGRIAPVLLAGAGAAGVILTLFFPCDPGCAPFVSLRGTLHIFIAIPMGFAILFSILMFAIRFGQDRRWRGLRPYSLASFGAGIAMAMTTVLLAETEMVGWLERALTFTYLQWYAVVGATVALRPADTP